MEGFSCFIKNNLQVTFWERGASNNGTSGGDESTKSNPEI